MRELDVEDLTRTLPHASHERDLSRDTQTREHQVTRLHHHRPRRHEWLPQRTRGGDRARMMAIFRVREGEPETSICNHRVLRERDSRSSSLYVVDRSAGPSATPTSPAPTSTSNGDGDAASSASQWRASASFTISVRGLPVRWTSWATRLA